jgi:hypothetical protein
VAFCTFDDNLILPGTAVKAHLETCIEYQRSKGDAETVSVALELYTFFNLIRFESTESSDIGFGPFQTVAHDVQEKLSGILKILYPTNPTK